jgi:hypothetical protein
MAIRFKECKAIDLEALTIVIFKGDALHHHLTNLKCRACSNMDCAVYLHLATPAATYTDLDVSLKLQSETRATSCSKDDKD